MSWVFRGCKMFSRGYFVGPKYFLVKTLWVQTFFSWLFRGFKMFSREYFVTNFVIQRFLFAGYIRKSDEKQKYINKSHTAYSILNRFQQIHSWSYYPFSRSTPPFSKIPCILLLDSHLYNYNRNSHVHDALQKVPSA